MTVLQNALGVVAEVKPGAEATLMELFEQLQPQIVANNVLPFGQLKTVHFARCVLVERTKDYPAYLVFSTYYDEPLSAHLDELLQVAGAGLVHIFSHCKDFPANGTVNDLVPFMLAHQRDYVAFYEGTRGRSRPQIEQEAALHDAIEGFLDDPDNRKRWPGMTPPEIRQAIQEFVRRDRAFDWTQTPYQPLSAYPDPARDATVVGRISNRFATLLIAFKTRQGAALARAKVALALFVALLVPPIALFLLLIWLKELGDRDHTVAKQAKNDLRPLVANEDFVAQNQLTHLVELKPGPIRSFSLQLVLSAIDVLARRYFIHGLLGGIPSIHFARWIMLDDGKRVLFFSDFDGSWENYLSDFIDRAARGLTAIWSNTEGFPKTRLLIWHGARDEQSFKAWTRDHQIRSNLWYSGYKRLSVQNINNNTEIRRGLWNAMSPDEIRAWLRRF